MEMYFISFENYHKTVDEKQLLKFVKIAVINNKDIGAFTVQRIEDVYVDEYGHPSYELANY